MPKPIFIKVQYDRKLQEITKIPEEPVTMSEGSTFLYLLMNIFIAHPEIEQKYPPGLLGLKVNGEFPRVHSVMFDGDVVKLRVE